MTKQQLLSQVDQVQNTLASLRAVIDDAFAHSESIEKDRQEILRLRKEMVVAQNELIAKNNRLKDDLRALELSQKGLQDDRASLQAEKDLLTKKEADLVALREKIEARIGTEASVAKREQKLKDEYETLAADRAKLNSEVAEFKDTRESIERQTGINKEWQIKLEIKEKRADQLITRAKRILGEI